LIQIFHDDRPFNSFVSNHQRADAIHLVSKTIEHPESPHHHGAHRSNLGNGSIRREIAIVVGQIFEFHGTPFCLSSELGINQSKDS
jgi:hypothetical protein